MKLPLPVISESGTYTVYHLKQNILGSLKPGDCTRDIQRHLQQVYGVEVSPETISNKTESVMADVREWQNRSLEKSYSILFLDALRVNSRQDGKNINKALYVALAIN